MTAILYIARHAESIWNEARLIQGQTDVPLSERGRAQAARLAVRLRHEPLDVIFTSDLARARDTATCVAEARSAGPDGHAIAGGPTALYVSQALRERCYGSWEGKTPAEAHSRGEHSLSKRAISTRSGQPAPGASGSPDVQHPPNEWREEPPGGESFSGTIQRMLRAWEDIERRLAAGATVLLVSHAAATRALMCGLMRTPADEQRRWQLHNVGLSRLDWCTGELRVTYWDDCTHTLGVPETVAASR